ncbi:MAG TPA: hypothetical protein VEP90_03720 [Methylomirabilota bacterium]|nr:hypothetical protein [Methylomirabilota bacterium]
MAPSRVAAREAQEIRRKLSIGTQYCASCKTVKPFTPELFGGHKSTCLECQRKFNKDANERRKLKVFTVYSDGTPRCACCGELELTVLTIDHINGGGNKHRKQIGYGKGSGAHTYRWLIHNNFPEGFRVLCMNCNWAVFILGHCYHSHTPH